MPDDNTIWLLKNMVEHMCTDEEGVHRLVFSIVPKPVQSVRVTRWGSYQPPAVVEFKTSIREQAKLQLDGPPSKLPIEILTIKYAFPFPQATKKMYLQAHQEGKTIYCDRKCDLDNLGKGFLDSLTGLCWEDDCQIVKTNNIHKVYDTHPYILLIYKELEGCLLLPKAPTKEKAAPKKKAMVRPKVRIPFIKARRKKC